MRKKLFVLVFLMASMCLLTACGKNKEIYDSGEKGFAQITAVDGISFDVVSDVSRNATAITNISEDMDFEPNQTYMYKDGETQYFLFRIDSIVCVAQKGTSFGLKDAENKLDAVTKGNILGIYFTSPKKKLEFVEDEKNGVYKMVATVTAQVALTNDLYNDFAGRLAYISNGVDEWTMFVGTIGQDFRDFSDDTKEIITYMAATLSLYEEPAAAEAPEPAISLGGEEALSSNVETVSGNSADDESDNAIIDMGEDSSGSDGEEQEISENEEIDNEPENPDGAEEAEIQEEVPVVQEEIEVEVIVEENEGDTLQEESAEQSEDVEAASNSESENKAEQKPESGFVRLNNQKNTVKDDTTVYTSNIYDILDVGKLSYADVLSADASCYYRATIRADKILTGTEAEAVIKDAYNKGIVTGNYFSPPEGCCFHVIHYTVAFPEGADGYVNVKLRGMDGEKLRFRGISYTQRTYDIKVSDTEFYAFYAVPNGCSEYVIEIGEGTVDNEKSGIVSAYYRYKKN